MDLEHFDQNVITFSGLGKFERESEVTTLLHPKNHVT